MYIVMSLIVDSLFGCDFTSILVVTLIIPVCVDRLSNGT